MMWVLLGAVLVILAAIGTMLASSLSKGVEEARASEAKKVASLSLIEGFKPAIVYEGAPANYGVAIDPGSSRFAIAIPGAKPRLYHFSQLVAAEVDRDGETITTTKGKIDTQGAAFGTLLAGPVGGLLAGAKTSSTSHSTTIITKLSLKLFVNDLHSPCFEILFGGGIAGSEPVNDAIRNLDDWYGRFRSIIADQQRQGPVGQKADVVQHDAPAPKPVQLGWAARTFGG
ncbi:hypothetical protein [Sphingomonas psychrotolerans]|uniref:Uncharacterized protein n=1 Tax=Sphingomonas psychrotolerans TaxID=1327635 RepID=A0A2K8MGB4_9SPHN|nr:hypothetical protein [Sphingomonas psychrotolerans]ATY30789.1 hypothetical protein CVN68_01255 [Sphingomonas psychrotolerans]